MHRDHDFARSDQAHWRDWLVQRQEDGFSWLKKIGLRRFAPQAKGKRTKGQRVIKQSWHNESRC
jgi:hypothetical protein